MAGLFAQQEDRLRRARAVLARVEARQEVVPTPEKIQGWEAPGRGVYHLDGTIEGAARALVQMAGPEQFVAVVDLHDVSWEGVEELGVDLSRIVLIRSVGEQGAKVIGSLLEGFSIVVVGNVGVEPRHQRALAARARTVGATILTMRPWVTVSLPLTDRVEGGSAVAENPLLRYRKEAS